MKRRIRRKERKKTMRDFINDTRLWKKIGSVALAALVAVSSFLVGAVWTAVRAEVAISYNQRVYIRVFDNQFVRTPMEAQQFFAKSGK